MNDIRSIIRFLLVSRISRVTLLSVCHFHRSRGLHIRRLLSAISATVMASRSSSVAVSASQKVEISRPRPVCVVCELESLTFFLLVPRAKRKIVFISVQKGRASAKDPPPYTHTLAYNQPTNQPWHTLESVTSTLRVFLLYGRPFVRIIRI